LTCSENSKPATMRVQGDLKSRGKSDVKADPM
jgi:hypothetical protein